MGSSIDLSDILDDVNNNNASLEETKTRIQQSYGSVQAAGDVRAQATLDSGNAAASVVGQTETGLLKAQNNSRQIAARLGTNLESNSARVIELADQMHTYFDAANRDLDVVHAKQSTSFASNPIGYLANQFTVGKDIDQYNYDVQKHNLASNELDSLNALTQQSTQTQVAIAATRSAASVQDKVTAITEKAKADAAEITQQNNIYNIDQLKTVQALNSTELQNRFNAFNAINMDEQRKFSNEQRLLARQEAETRLQDLKDRAAQKKLVDQDLIDIGDTVNLGRSSLGLPAIPVSKAMQMMKIGGDLGKQIQEQYKLGAIRDSTGQVVLGTSPSEAARVIITTGAPLSPGAQPVKDYVLGVYGEVMQSGGDPLHPVTSKSSVGEVDAAVNQAINTTSHAMLANIKPGDHTNIYQAPDLGSIAANNIGVATSPLYQTVFKPVVNATKNNVVETNPQVILDQSMAAVAAGQVSYNDAVQGVATIFQAATALNKATKQYGQFGLPAPSPANEYNVRIKTGLFYNKSYNLSNPTDVVRYMTLKQLTDVPFEKRVMD